MDVRRFRAHIVLEADGSYPEDGWVGATLEIGSAQTRIDQRDQRSVLINVDPDSGRRDPSLLKAIALERQSCLGVYASTVRPGQIKQGDPVRLA